MPNNIQTIKCQEYGDEVTVKPTLDTGEFELWVRETMSEGKTVYASMSRTELTQLYSAIEHVLNSD